MIKQELWLPKYAWEVTIYYAVTKMYSEEIVEDLKRIGCKGEDLETAKKNLSAGKVDTGLTFSNYRRCESVIVIARTSTPAEFLNSYDHERKHLEAHIADAYGLDPYGEDIAYLCGEIGQKMYPVSKQFVCEHCKNNIQKTQVQGVG